MAREPLDPYYEDPEISVRAVPVDFALFASVHGDYPDLDTWSGTWCIELWHPFESWHEVKAYGRFDTRAEAEAFAEPMIEGEKARNGRSLGSR